LSALGILDGRTALLDAGRPCAMHQFAHLVDRAVHWLQPILIFIAMGGWAIAMIGQISAYRSRKPGSAWPISGKFIAGMLVFAGVIGGEFAIAAFVKSAALHEINPKLAANVEALTINGTQFDRTNELLADLRSMHGTVGHHSHPTVGYRVHLTSSRGLLELQLCRDSANPHEYWVFYPAFYSTKMNDIGHVFTNALDGI